MIVRFLVYLKHRFPFIWNWIESLNGLVFSILHGRKLNRLVAHHFKNQSEKITFRPLTKDDLPALEQMLADQPEMKFFNPHGFDSKSLKRAFNNKAFLMMGAFDDTEIAGYFFLRFFVNNKCFIGRMVDVRHQRKGIAKGMSHHLYSIAWDMNFRCLTTISKNNKAIFDLHNKENNIAILQELDNDYVLVEMLKKQV